MRRPTAAVSIDADFFTLPDEQLLLAPLLAWLHGHVASGRPVVLRDDHADLVATLPHPVEVIVNFDFHMDLTIEFLLGAPAAPVADAAVFESLLAEGRTERYVWAHPVQRRATAARVYASALLADRQPLLSAIHCLPGPEALDLLAELDVVWAFVCRSPGYATPDTEAAFSACADSLCRA